jgi:hypothetical protein
MPPRKSTAAPAPIKTASLRKLMGADATAPDVEIAPGAAAFVKMRKAVAIEKVMGSIPPRPDVLPDTRRPTWPTTATFSDVFGDPPAGWKSVFDEAKEELGFIFDILNSQQPKKPGCLVPNPTYWLAPFWSVPSPSLVRVVVFFGTPTPGCVGGCGAGEGAAPGRRRTAGPAPAARTSISQGLGPAGAELEFLEELAREARPTELPENGLREGESVMNRWCRQGVLPLTANLVAWSTDTNGKNSFPRAWLAFYQYVIDGIRSHTQRVPTLLIGASEIMSLQLDSSSILFSPSIEEAMEHPERRAKLVCMLRRLNEVLEERDEPMVVW